MKQPTSNNLIRYFPFQSSKDQFSIFFLLVKICRWDFQNNKYAVQQGISRYTEITITVFHH